MTLLAEIVAKVEHPSAEFVTGHMGDGYFVQVRFTARCAKTGMRKDWTGRKWYVSSHSTESEVVQTCLKAVLTAMEHETRETFTYKGVALFAPHLDVNKLIAFASDDANLDVRDTPPS